MSKRKAMYITHHSLLEVKPIGDTQKKVFEAYAAEKNIFAQGVAGSGKTFILLYLALKEVLDKRYKRFEKTINQFDSEDLCSITLKKLHMYCF